MYRPARPHVQAPPTRQIKFLAHAGLVLNAIFLIIIIVLVLQLLTQYRRTNDKATLAADLSKLYTNTQEQLTLANRQLIVQSLLPDPTSFPSQCPGGNEKDALFTPLSKTPIEGYNVFLVDCRTNITTGSSHPRVLVFHVNNQKGIDYVYGSSALEPLCLSNKLPVANRLSTQLLLPVCQTN